jgi:SAM-dependent methyltransferase
MFKILEEINCRPEPFQFYTAEELWTDEYVSAQMLKYHLNEDVDISSRNIEFIKGSVAWIASYLNIGAGTRIADFGCGPGLYATRLARLKADVTGIDFSKRSIQYAKEIAGRENLSINYINQDYLEYETDDRFDLVMMIMCDFCALSPAQRKAILDKFNRILEQGGAVLLDVYSMNAYDKREEKVIFEKNLLDGFWSPNNYYGFLNTFKYDNEKVVLDKYTIAEAERTRTIYNWLQYFSPESLENEFAESGFAIEKFFADVASSPFDPESDEFAVVVRKR